MNSFNVVGNTSACSGVVWDVNTGSSARAAGDARSQARADGKRGQPKQGSNGNDSRIIIPNIDMGGGHFGTRCTDACATVNKCASGNEANCMVTVLDHYTSSFNWAQTNVAAIWLRPQWNLMLQSALTDVQNGGLTFRHRRRLHALLGAARGVGTRAQERIRGRHPADQ